MFEDTVVREPAKLAGELLAEMVALLAAGGEIEVDGLEQRLKSAELVVLRSSGDRLIAMAAIKRPTLYYRNGVFRKAGLPPPSKSIDWELGYVVVDEEFRGNGLGPALVAVTAGQLAAPLYSTSRSRTVQAALLALGFTQAGEPYTTDPEKKPLRLYIRGIELPTEHV